MPLTRLDSRGGFSGRSPSSSSSVALLAVAVDLDRDLLARVEQLHGLGQVVGVADLAVLDAGDDVAALGERARLEADLAAAAAQAGLLARAVGLDDLQPRALADRQVEALDELRVELAPTARRGRRSGPCRPSRSPSSERRTTSAGTAKPTPSPPPERDLICWLTPITRPRPSTSGPARVAGVDRRVGLDRAGDLELGQRVDRAVDRRHDADRQRLLLAERRADRGHRRADLHGVGAARAAAAAASGPWGRP